MTLSLDTQLPPVRRLGLDGWPSWLTGTLTTNVAARHGATAMPVKTGGLVLLCHEMRGYYWR